MKYNLEEDQLHPGSTIKEAAENAWIHYKWQDEVMLHNTTFKKGFYEGNDYGVKRVLKLVSENISAQAANDIENLLMKQ